MGSVLASHTRYLAYSLVSRPLMAWERS